MQNLLQNLYAANIFPAQTICLVGGFEEPSTDVGMNQA
jgi:hypothetical protein